jgi:hypothetical protein
MRPPPDASDRASTVMTMYSYSTTTFRVLTETEPLRRPPLVGLLALKQEGDRLVLRPYDADHHAAIRGKRVRFERNHAGLCIRHLQDVVIPLRLGLEVFARVNRGIVFTVGNVAVEESVASAFILEIARDGDVTIPLVDCHGAGLNHGLAGKIALGGHQGPGTIQGGVLVRGRQGGEE